MATARQRQVTEALAAEIRSIAARQNLKSFHLHRMTGIPKSTMANIWNGETAIDVDQIARIARALAVDPGQLLVDAIANARIEPGDDPDLPAEVADAIDSANQLTRRQRERVRDTLRSENRVTGKSTPDESLGSSERQHGRAGNG